MAKLGEAYVQVRADLNGFNKDLEAQLKALTTRFEKTLNQDFGKKLGSNIGKGTADGFKESTKALADDLQKELDRVGLSSGKSSSKKFRKGFGDGLNDRDSSFYDSLKRWVGSVVSTVEDGFSALPAELKLILGAALIGTVIPAGAFAGAAFSAAVIGGVAGIGVALASQFEQVQERWTPFVDGLREDFVLAASAFLPQTLQALDYVEERIQAILPTIESIFDTVARFVGPLTQGTVDLLEKSLTGLNNGLQSVDFQDFADSLVTGFNEVGDAIGEAFELILSNPDIGTALGDLLTALAWVVRTGAEFVDWAVASWMIMREVLDVITDVYEALFSLSMAFTGLIALNEDWTEAGLLAALNAFNNEKTIKIIARDFDGLTASEEGAIKATKKQEKAAKELNKQLSDQNKLINDIIATNVDYEASIDAVTEGYKENKSATLNTKDEKGRTNVSNIREEINLLGEYTKQRVAMGELTEEQSKRFYDNEIKRIRDEHVKRGGNIEDFNRIFNLLIQINSIPVTPPKLDNLTGSANAAEDAILRAKAALTNLNNTPIRVRAPGQPVNIPHYADGGFVSSPQVIMAGENYKPEVVLPLTNPARSMQLLSQTPLAGMLGGGTNVAVFIGNEQLDSRMFRVAQGAQKQAARTMTQGPRTI
jgi:hypothetical protein